MAPVIKNYFATGNSSKGFYNFFDSNLQGIETLYILKGGPGTGKSTLMKRIGSYFFEKGYDIDFLHCSSDNQSIDGVLIPSLHAGIVDGTAPHVIEPTAPGAIEEYVNLGIAWDRAKLKPHTTEILTLRSKISDCYSQLYKHFAQALEIHDEWEKIYINHMDFEKAPIFRQHILDTLVDYPAIDHKPTIKHRFFGGSTPTGSVDFVQNLTQNLESRYFIKGRPGTGKSTLLRAIAKKSEALGYDTEVYHCSFDPDSLDMVLIPDLSICFFDSTAPHEYFPTKSTDHIIDTYEAFITPGTDELYATELANIAKRYKEKVAQGVSYLAKAKALHDQLENYYIAAVDFDIIESIYEELKDNLEALEN
ncbi:MAG: PRK06851 family protein [Turicibacter sp.]